MSFDDLSFVGYLLGGHHDDVSVGIDLLSSGNLSVYGNLVMILHITKRHFKPDESIMMDGIT